MSWCVRSLKIIGEGLVEVSSVCSHEFVEGHFEDFAVVNPEQQEIIQVLVFAKHLFEMQFFGQKTEIYTMHFVKVKQGKLDWIQESDYQVIASVYNKKVGKQLKII
ncbi:hypothetical protein [Ectobacillus ponti]|uniref:Uncharacterized protein n=1 Tax=Ectobacillus ponti TaxID=2961894 RepID=A0AA42BQ35_9BACI|nr:hypothetical protein [Ectobacillus ponti]MCP8968996.1 hypothetical protein [Ectobacillus ponti]